MITDLWPTTAAPGHGAFVRSACLALSNRGHDLQVAFLRRWCPPKRVLSACIRPATLAAVMNSWVEQSWRSAPIAPPSVTCHAYSSPPRGLSHDRWGSWAIAIAGSAIVRQAQAMRPHVIHGHWATPAGHVAVWAGKRLGVPSVISLHGSDVDYTAVFRARGARSLRSVVTQADAVVSNSGPIAREAVRLFGLSEDQVTVLWQGGDIVSVQEPRAGGAAKVPSVVTVGAIGSIKGHHHAARALASARERGAAFHWTVIGRGSIEQEAAFREQLTALGMRDLVTMVPKLTNAEVLEVMAEADVFLLLSTREPYGVVYAEALGAGAAVVGSSLAGAMVDFRDAGAPVLVVDPHDNTSASDAVCDLLMDPHRLETIKSESREWAKQNLGWDRHAARLECLYRDLLRASH